MELGFKIAAGSVVAVILITTLRSQNRELALVLSLLVCALIAAAGTGLLDQISGSLTRMGEDAGLNPAVLSPLFKVCLISVFTQIACSFCNDAQEHAVANMVELCGCAASVVVALPLLEMMADLLKKLAGG